jgi:FkbM family methyltransferase
MVSKMLSLVSIVLSVIGGSSAATLRGLPKQRLLNANLNASHAAIQASSRQRNTPCACDANNPAWKPTTRTVPKCIFIDLGAADGNSFRSFLSNAYGPVANCPSGGQWEAWLVEANGQFSSALAAEQTVYPQQVHELGATAAYMCKGTTSFSIDPDVAHNRWGSSMKVDHGVHKISVPLVNVIQLVAENTIPADWVMLKVDVEGAEFDIIPCLAQFPNARLVDRMYLEEHTWLSVDSAYTKEQYEQAKATLRTAGVDIPNYFSQTM